MTAARRGRAILIAAGVVAVLLVAVVAWVLVRALLAERELRQAQPLLGSVRTSIAAGDADAALVAADELAARARNAAELTSDPVWRLAEGTPWAGDDLAAVRRLAGAVRGVAEDGVVPLATSAAATGFDAFRPADGRIDLAAVAALGPPLADAAEAVADARAELGSIRGELTRPVADARDELDGMLADAADLLDGAGRAVRIVPAMLGADGPRDTLLLFQNPAELRSLGGIPGALALVHAEDGAVGLVQQATASGLGAFTPPAVELPIDTRALWGQNTARWVQDVTFTPQFPLAASIAREMWRQRYGQTPDAVVAIDPVALGYLLRATGPIPLSTGETLTADDAATILLQGVYRTHPEPAVQDAVFAEAARAVFTALTDGRAQPAALADALARAGAERRILVWDADPATQALLSGTSLAGGLPVSDAHRQAFGVYLNDLTVAKMDSYLEVRIGSGVAVCRNDGLPEYRIEVSLRNTAPADAATALPQSLTGDGGMGTPPGSIATSVHVYSAPGSYNLGVSQHGERVPAHPAGEAGYTLSKVVATLAPGESTSWTFAFLGGEAGARTPVVEATPGVHPAELRSIPVVCAPVAG